MKTYTQPVQYEIRVERHLGPGVAALFPEFTVSEDGGSTLLHGVLPDQAALHGVLLRIRDLGLTLVSMARVADAPAHADSGEGRLPLDTLEAPS